MSDALENSRLYLLVRREALLKDIKELNSKKKLTDADKNKLKSLEEELETCRLKLNNKDVQ